MTKEEFERELTERLEDIRALYRRYNPEAFTSKDKEYLTMTLMNGTIHANNRHFKIGDVDATHPVSIFKRLEEV